MKLDDEGASYQLSSGEMRARAETSRRRRDAPGRHRSDLAEPSP